jgi:transcriptional regulator with XRE-family HTH domain
LSIEGHRAWVSDKTLIALSNALGMEVFQLFTHTSEDQKKSRRSLSYNWLLKLRQEIKKDINTNVDMHFERLFNMNVQE